MVSAERRAGDLILMGPPGSGKGTQAQLLAKEPRWVHVSTGELFRENLTNGTPLGKLAGRYMSKGEYVPDDVTVGMVRERLRSIPPTQRIVFDGFPRTVAQAEALDALLRDSGRPLPGVVLIECSRDELVGRSRSAGSRARTTRRTWSASASTYTRSRRARSSPTTTARGWSHASTASAM